MEAFIICELYICIELISFYIFSSSTLFCFMCVRFDGRSLLILGRFEQVIIPSHLPKYFSPFSRRFRASNFTLLWFYYYCKAEVKMMMWWCSLRWRRFIRTHCMRYCLRNHFGVAIPKFVLFIFRGLCGVVILQQWRMHRPQDSESECEMEGEWKRVKVVLHLHLYQRKRPSFLHTNRKVALCDRTIEKKTEFVCVESDSPNEFMIKILSIVVCNIFFLLVILSSLGSTSCTLS